MKCHQAIPIGILSALALAGTGRADIIGFNNLNGWQYNQNDVSSPPDIINSDSLQFTGGPSNNRSLWHNTRQSISDFSASFRYRASNVGPGLQGITFAIHASPDGTNAISPGGSGVGYAGISPSVAVTIENSAGPGETFSGLYTNGILGESSAATAPVNGFDNEPIDIFITYSAPILSVRMVQGTNTHGPRNYFVGSLVNLLGSSNAYVGFTGATGAGVDQYLSNFRFGRVPEPTTASLLILAASALIARRRS